MISLLQLTIPFLFSVNCIETYYEFVMCLNLTVCYRDNMLAVCLVSVFVLDIISLSTSHVASLLAPLSTMTQFASISIPDLLDTF
jgi:hypothetical protein